MEYDIHISMICCTWILKAKRSDLIEKGSLRSSKGGFLLVLFCDLDLIIAWESIHGGYNFVASSRIDNHVDVKKRKVIFRTCFVDVPEICVNPYTNMLLLNMHYVGNPFRVINRYDESNNISSSSLIKIATCKCIFHNFCLIGFVDSCTMRLCMTKEWSKPDMSTYEQTNVSENSQRSIVKYFSSCAKREAPSLKILGSSFVLMLISIVSSTSIWIHPPYA